MNTLRNPKMKIILGCFALISLVLYWKILTWATSSYVSTDDQFPAVISDGDAMEVDYSSLRSNCRRIWSTSVTRWIMARMDKTKVAVWDKKHSKLHYQLNSWWILQSPAGTSVDAEAIFDELYGRGVPVNDLVEEMRKKSRDCFDCALVGDSPDLLNNDFGKEIDGHKIVIRLGADSVEGFEYYVGKKTTIRIVTSNDIIGKQDKDSLLLFAPYKPEDLTELFGTILESDRNYQLDKTLVMHPGFIRYAYERWVQRNGNTISLKFLSVVFALHKCDSISLYGMWSDDATASRSRTYWKDFDETMKDRGRIGGQYDSEYERGMIEQLEMKNIIKIHK